MITHKFTLAGCDTDAITFCKNDGSAFSEIEQNELLNELNSLFPPGILWSKEDYFSKVIIFKAKNYVLYSNGKMKIKGSALKDAKKEIALKDFLGEVIKAIIDDKPHSDLQEIYHTYVREIRDGLKDIKRWCGKKTLTSTIFTSERANETKVLDAIRHTEYVESDKIWTYFKSDDTLGLMENFDGDYHVDKMLEKLYKTSKLFDTVLPNLFINYKLKKNKELLKNL